MFLSGTNQEYNNKGPVKVVKSVLFTQTVLNHLQNYKPKSELHNLLR